MVELELVSELFIKGIKKVANFYRNKKAGIKDICWICEGWNLIHP